MSRYSPNSIKPDTALCVIHCEDLGRELSFFTDQLGFVLDLIYPADDPRVAEISGFGLRIRLVRESKPSHSVLVIKTSEEIGASLPRQSPGGTTLIWESDTTPLEIPSTQHQFEVRTLKGSAPWIIGRAGMHYRDLIPSRLGGSIIASHIRIPDGGPVPDMVHYHTVGFQLIYCVTGWVKLVYEDQGDEFFLRAGDCVTQPPEIRHRVLEASDGLEVIEIGVPAEHITTIDHDMTLPNSTIDRLRLFDGQRFCHHRVDDAKFSEHRLPGFLARETGVRRATDSAACVQVIHPNNTQDKIYSSHEADILFNYVLAGSVTIQDQQLVAGDAYTLPPNERHHLGGFSDDLSILEVSLPGVFSTSVHSG